MTGLIDPSLWQSVEFLTVPDGRSCPVCGWETHHFYRLGAEPNPDDPDERGFCGGCLADLLAGNGLFEESNYRVIDADQCDLEYPVISVEVHMRGLPDDEAVQQDIAASFAQVLEDELESFPEGAFGVNLDVGHVGAQVFEPETDRPMVDAEPGDDND